MKTWCCLWVAYGTVFMWLAATENIFTNFLMLVLLGICALLTSIITYLVKKVGDQNVEIVNMKNRARGYLE